MQDDLGTRNQTGASQATWDADRSYWRSNFRSRSYASADRGFDFFEPAYRYGHESALRHRGRDWSDLEGDLRSGWDRYEHRGSNRSTWDEIKAAVKDAWDRVTGSDDRGDRSADLGSTRPRNEGRM